MMELQIVVTLAAVMFLGNVLSLLGLDAEMTNIFRILCFGYCIYGLFKCLTIILLYFDDRKGACVSAALFAIFSVLLTALTLKAGTYTWGMGFLGAGAAASAFALLRLKWYLKNLEYHVFCRQPLFSEPEDGVFHQLEERFSRADRDFAAKAPGRKSDNPPTSFRR